MEVRLNGQTERYPDGTLLAEIVKAHEGETPFPAALALVNGSLKELHHKAKDGDVISFVTIDQGIGFEAYRRSCAMLFLTAVQNVLGAEKGSAILHFSVSSGFYFTLRDVSVSDDVSLPARIEKEMRRLTDAHLPFVKKTVSTQEARRIFRDAGMTDKEVLFRTRMASRANIYMLGTYEDYYYGFMVHDTSVLRYFRLDVFRDGIVLMMPEQGRFGEVPPLQTSEKLFDAQIRGEQWAERLGIGTVGDLNRKIISGEGANTVLVSEALQEGAISQIASAVREKPAVKFIMIAGPSSSGKTTFSQRLCIQLTAHGLRPHCIGVDNYFIDRADMVPGPDGKLDFESLDAVDVRQFNEDMTTLLNGGTIKMPTFDFVSGKRVYTGETLTLGKGELLVIEGLHCLNDKLSYSLPQESKFRIYISALTQLNIDEHNRVPSADGRLIRRIVRDYRTRGSSASRTIAMWGSVRSGEEKYIFPYQEQADIFFNTALPYEIAALKTYVQPLLFQVQPDDPSWYEARRLLKFLDYFVAIPSEGIPTNSLLREFIGGGCFRL